MYRYILSKKECIDICGSTPKKKVYRYVLPPVSNIKKILFLGSLNN